MNGYRGYRVRVPARRREDAKALLVLPGVEVIETDIHDETCLRELLSCTKPRAATPTRPRPGAAPFARRTSNCRARWSPPAGNAG